MLAVNVQPVIRDCVQRRWDDAKGGQSILAGYDIVAAEHLELVGGNWRAGHPARGFGEQSGSEIGNRSKDRVAADCVGICVGLGSYTFLRALILRAEWEFFRSPRDVRPGRSSPK